MTGPKWQITQITANDAEKLAREKRTGSLTIHYAQGKPCAYEWKEKVTEVDRIVTNNDHATTLLLTPFRADVL